MYVNNCHLELLLSTISCANGLSGSISSHIVNLPKCFVERRQWVLVHFVPIRKNKVATDGLSAHSQRNHPSSHHTVAYATQYHHIRAYVRIRAGTLQTKKSVVQDVTVPCMCMDNPVPNSA